MTLAVVAILGHFGKTLLLFFIPQVINFVYSVPQLFRLIPCPRHRLPKYNEETDLREMSTVEFKASDLKPLGKLCLYIFSWVGLGPLRRYSKDSEDYIEINNFYTPTVYEKGAEVIRMIFNYLGENLYRKGMNVYFESYDGKAVTCENFIDALTKGSKSDLTIFKKWYSQAGTPTLRIKREI